MGTDEKSIKTGQSGNGAVDGSCTRVLWLSHLHHPREYIVPQMVVLITPEREGTSRDVQPALVWIHEVEITTDEDTRLWVVS